MQEYSVIVRKPKAGILWKDKNAGPSPLYPALFIVESSSEENVALLKQLNSLELEAIDSKSSGTLWPLICACAVDYQGFYLPTLTDGDKLTKLPDF